MSMHLHEADKPSQRPISCKYKVSAMKEKLIFMAAKQPEKGGSSFGKAGPRSRGLQVFL